MMSGSVERRRRRSVFESDMDADQTRWSSAPSPPTSDGAKRLRLRGGEGSSSDEDEEEQDATFYSANDYDHGRDEREPNTRDADGPAVNRMAATDYKPGAIVRVLVSNFVTYEHAEFFPGPNLNMVIGPNGTGKSSLVCAICLGLGYHSNVLGRATSFGDFVKHGKDHAIVEVELQKRPKDSQNFTVKLRINREDNSRKFWLNGKDITKNKLQVLITKFRIQIDNLCQFLPQDKVAEFAGLSPVDLLGKTLQAAAEPQMIKWQDQMKEIYARQKEIQASMGSEAEQLRSMENRQQGLQADVERFRERAQIKKLVEDLRACRLLAQYRELREQFTSIKARRQQATEKLKNLEREMGPSLQAVTEKQKYQHRIKKALEDRTDALKRAEQAADAVMEDIFKCEREVQDIQNKRDAQTRLLEKQRKQIGDRRRQITALEASMKDDRSKNFDAQEFNTRIVRLRSDTFLTPILMCI